MQNLYIFPWHKEKQIHNESKLELNKFEPAAKIKSHYRYTPISSIWSTSKLRTHFMAMKRGTSNAVIKSCWSPGFISPFTGYMHGIIYSKGRFPSQLADAILTEFPKYTGPPFIPGHPQIVPIVPFERRMECCNLCRHPNSSASGMGYNHTWMPGNDSWGWWK